jgi:putative PIN family toxin of toxin-antitoxin system
MSVPLWVIDTNVVVSAALNPGRVCDVVLQHAVAGHFLPAWDNSILAEYREVLSRPKFGLSRSCIKELLSAFPASGFRRGVSTKIQLSDPGDTPFVAVALATEDKTIITGNPKHLSEAVSQSVKILSPRDALDLLDRLLEKIPPCPK